MSFGPSPWAPYNLNQFRPFGFARSVIVPVVQVAATYGKITAPGPHATSPRNLNKVFHFPAGYTISIPLSPAVLIASAGNASVSLSWNPVPGATSYSVYMGLIPGGEVLIASNVLVPAYFVSPLVNGVTYYFKVAAVNPQGFGPLSNEASATPQALGSQVIVSIKMELTEIVRGSIALAWTSFPTNFPTALYQVSVNDVIVATTTTVRIATVTGLAVDTPYLVKIVGGVPGQLPVQSNIIAYEYGSTEIPYVNVPLRPVDN